MTDLFKSRKPFKSRYYERFQPLKKTNRNRKSVPQMTDFLRKTCKSQYFQRIHSLKKPYTVDIHFDTYGIVALTEKQCIHNRYCFLGNDYFTVFYRIIPLCTAVKKQRFTDGIVNRKMLARHTV